MYTYEAYVATAFFAFFGMLMALILWNTFVKPTFGYLCTIHQRRFERKHPVMSMKEISDAMEKQLDEVLQDVEQKEFFKMIEDAQNGKYDNATPLPQSRKLPVLVPCIFHECSMHASREDCCKSNVEVNGQSFCTALIDIDTMQEVGVEFHGDPIVEPPLMTDEEIKQFQTLYIKFMKEVEKSKNG